MNKSLKQKLENIKVNLDNVVLSHRLYSDFFKDMIFNIFFFKDGIRFLSYLHIPHKNKEIFSGNLNHKKYNAFILLVINLSLTNIFTALRRIAILSECEIQRKPALTNQNFFFF